MIVGFPRFLLRSPIRRGFETPRTILRPLHWRHLQIINENLRRYCETFTGPKHFDGFLHLSTEDLANVYGWRLDQEKALRNHKSAMSNEQVLRFVRSYMPAYELFLDRLQHESLFGGDDSRLSAKALLHDRLTL